MHFDELCDPTFCLCCNLLVFSVVGRLALLVVSAWAWRVVGQVVGIPLTCPRAILHRLVPLSEFVGFSLLATEVGTYALSDLGRTQHSVNHVEGPCLVLLCF